MFKKLLVLFITLFILSCSVKIDDITHGTNKLNLVEIKITKGVTTKNHLISTLGPPSIKNPYKKNIVYYTSQNMKRNITKRDTFKEVVILEIVFDKNDIVIDYNLTKNKKVKEFIINEEKDKYFKSRDKFNFFKDMLDSMRRNQKQ